MDGSTASPIVFGGVLELLPLDDSRRGEYRVVHVFLGRSLDNPALVSVPASSRRTFESNSPRLSATARRMAKWSRCRRRTGRNPPRRAGRRARRQSRPHGGAATHVAGRGEEETAACLDDTSTGACRTTVRGNNAHCRVERAPEPAERGIVAREPLLEATAVPQFGLDRGELGLDLDEEDRAGVVRFSTSSSSDGVTLAHCSLGSDATS